MSADLQAEDYDAIVRVLQGLVADVWDEQSLSVHIRQACVIPSGKQFILSETQVERVMLFLANMLGLETDGSYTPVEYLDSLGWFHGMTHQRFIEMMRAWLREHHPEADSHDYARARRSPRAEPDRGQKVPGA